MIPIDSKLKQILVWKNELDIILEDWKIKLKSEANFKILEEKLDHVAEEIGNLNDEINKIQ